MNVEACRPGCGAGETETKFALLAKKGRFWGVLSVLGEFCTACGVGMGLG